MIYQKVGSFGSLGTNVNIATGNPTFQADLKFNYSTAVNDFPFTKENGEVVNQRNASFARVGLSQELFWRLKTRHLISAKAWYSQDDRSLPPTEFTYDLPKTETLNDKFLRAVLEYKLVNEGWSVQVRSALNYQFMIYDNNLPEINSAHRSVSWINRIRFSYARIKNLTIRPGIDFTHDRVQSKDYESELTTRNTTSLFIELAYDFTRKLKSSIVLREDIIDGSFGNLIPAFGIEYLPFNKINLAFTANASRNYRYPTLNDLFWKSAGSPDLQPETNYAFEVGGTFQIGNRSHVWYLETTLTGFYYRIFDMIAWIQSEEESLFRPENIDEVFSRGLETGLNFGKRVCKFWLEMKTNYAFCKSTYENLRSPNDERLHRQQTYMPVHNFNSSVSIERWNYYCHYNISYISYRYTNTDNIMPGYSLSNIIFGKEFKLKQFILSLQLDINNLFNLDYQAIDSRPMPGINYAFSVKLNFSMPGSSQINNQDKP
jgi:iron complex outermembrane receptor protein